MSIARRCCVLAALAAAVTCGPAVAADEPAPGSWRIRCYGGADSHGWIVLSFVEGGEVRAEISAPIPNGTPENDVARRVRKSLRRALPADQYRVEVEGGENVVVTAKGDAQPFEIRLLRNTASGTVVTVVRE